MKHYLQIACSSAAPKKLPACTDAHSYSTLTHFSSLKFMSFLLVSSLSFSKSLWTEVQSVGLSVSPVKLYCPQIRPYHNRPSITPLENWDSTWNHCVCLFSGDLVQTKIIRRNRSNLFQGPSNWMHPKFNTFSDSEEGGRNKIRSTQVLGNTDFVSCLSKGLAGLAFLLLENSFGVLKEHGLTLAHWILPCLWSCNNYTVNYNPASCNQ